MCAAGMLDFGQEGSDDFVWSFEVAFGEALGDEFLVCGRYVCHVVARL